MTGATARRFGPDGGADSGHGWRVTSFRLPACGHDHGAARGHFDETARRVDHAELAAADLLVSEGHTVRSLSDRRGKGPVADFDVCGTAVEVKTLVARDERPGGRPANERSVFNRLMSGIDQAPITLLMTKGSGLGPADAAAGVARFARVTDELRQAALGSGPGRRAAHGRAPRTGAVRVVGDGWDLAWTAPVGLDRGATTPAPRGRERSAPRNDPCRFRPRPSPVIGLG